MWSHDEDELVHAAFIDVAVVDTDEAYGVCATAENSDANKTSNQPNDVSDVNHTVERRKYTYSKTFFVAGGCTYCS